MCSPWESSDWVNFAPGWPAALPPKVHDAVFPVVRESDETRPPPFWAKVFTAIDVVVVVVVEVVLVVDEVEVLLVVALTW
jgi:hypothetical protein